MCRKTIIAIISAVMLLCLLSACGATQDALDIPDDVTDPSDVVFEPLHAETKFTSGRISIETGKIENNDAYGYIINYPVKKGRVLSVSDQKYLFSIIKFENGAYSNVIKEASRKNYTVEEDMNIAIQICKADQTPIAEDELAKIVIRDTVFRMTDVVGNIHRFTVDAGTFDGGIHTTRAALFMPVSYSESGTAQKLILMTHGHSGFLSDNAWYSNSEENTQLIDAYLKSDYAVYVVDNTSGVEGKCSDMGCPQLIDSYFKAYEYIQDNFNVEKQIYIHSRSFGTFASLRIMQEHPELVKCALMTGPRVSMQKEWDENRPDKDHVANRFGFEDRTGKTYEADKLIGHDPYTDIQSGSYTLPPTFWMLTAGDMTERPEEFIDALEKGGNDVTSSTYTGLDHTGICALDLKQALNDALEYLNKH